MACDGLDSNAKPKHNSGGKFNRKRVLGKGYQITVEAAAPRTDASDRQTSNQSSERVRVTSTVRTRDHNPSGNVTDASTVNGRDDTDLNGEAASAPANMPLNVADGILGTPVALKASRPCTHKRKSGNAASAALNSNMSDTFTVPLPTSSNGASFTSASGLMRKERMEDAEDSEEIWCYCAKPYGGRLMIECSNRGACPNRWLHASCVPLSEAEVKSLKHKPWYCRDCAKLDRPSRNVVRSSDDVGEAGSHRINGSEKLRAESELVKAVKIRSTGSKGKRDPPSAAFDELTSRLTRATPPNLDQDSATSGPYGVQPYASPQVQSTVTVAEIVETKNTISSRTKPRCGSRSSAKPLVVDKRQALAFFRADLKETGIMRSDPGNRSPAKDAVFHVKPVRVAGQAIIRDSDDDQDEAQKVTNFNYYSAGMGWDNRVKIEESFERGRPMNNAPARTRRNSAAFIEADQVDSQVFDLDAPPSPTGTILNEDAGKTDVFGTGIDPEDRLRRRRMHSMLRAVDMGHGGHEAIDAESGVGIFHVNSTDRDVSEAGDAEEHIGISHANATKIDEDINGGEVNFEDDAQMSSINDEIMEVSSDGTDAEITNVIAETIEISSDEDDAQVAGVNAEIIEISSDEGSEVAVTLGVNLSRPIVPGGKGRTIHQSRAPSGLSVW
ncbi:hypothetical protein EJ03DRAFT_374586 [Teratosphaeria nubilosa]|uniref:Zinc finger PHD-type domain-containing protein n=1 Tax=Teratosphaeria nubilosa TaxID=161662 RepID=A0A6G1L9B3_9PEZI|nr:hypothetical protein EJ03DRAFT_374586 [Teratosphaeria nubilosa]